MTVITYRTQNRNDRASPKVWRCEECHCFHLLAEQTLLTFTPQEFATFTEDIAECYCVQLPISDDDLDAVCSSEKEWFDVAGR